MSQTYSGPRNPLEKYVVSRVMVILKVNIEYSICAQKNEDELCAGFRYTLIFLSHFLDKCLVYKYITTKFTKSFSVIEA